MATKRLMASLLSFALACDQTRVFSMIFSDRISGLRQPGSSAQHHQLTHDEALAKAHGITGIPMMIAATAQGALRPGVHVAGATSSTTRVGLTVQQIMGLNTESWGTRSMEATQPVSEILA